jgi:hypothetical protein
MIMVIWKVAGCPKIIAVLDVDSHDTTEQALFKLPSGRLGMPTIDGHRMDRAAALRELGQGPEEAFARIRDKLTAITRY